MIRNKKKGFTIVELVIVIAVIGILSAVLIPVFSNVVSNANAIKQQQQLTQAYTDYVQNIDAKEYDIVAENDVYLVKIATSGDAFAEAWKRDSASGEWKDLVKDTSVTLTFANYEQAEGLEADFETFNGYKVYVEKTGA